jgi:hypothetical protein
MSQCRCRRAGSYPLILPSKTGFGKHRLRRLKCGTIRMVELPSLLPRLADGAPRDENPTKIGRSLVDLGIGACD